MSISASWLVLCVMLFRLVFQKAPKWMRTVLWGLVGLRLVMPISLKSALSLIPSAETVRPEILYTQQPTIDSGVSVVDDLLDPVISASMTPTATVSVNPLQIWVSLAAVLWIVGLAVMLLYGAVSFLRLRGRMKTAVLLCGNIYQSEHTASPFVLGFVRPRIYLPFGLAEDTATHVIAHERAHIRRRDHLIKPLGYLLLSIYWFNPVLWLAYLLLCRDIELACDEKVIRNLGMEARADYSQALLYCSVSHRSIAACPLAFGEVGVKERVNRVLHYKRPVFWIVAVAVVASIVLAVCFLTDPVDYSQEISLNGSLYTQSGDAVEALPENSVELGALSGVLHRTREHPTEHLTGANLDEKYAGCTVYQSGAQANVIYLEDLGGFYLPFVCENGLEPAVVTWFDYLDHPEDMDMEGEHNIELPAFPGVTFRWTYTEISEVTADGVTPRLTGMPIWNCFFSDLTGDGKPELCMTFSEGSVIIDQRVLVYDHANDQTYMLNDRQNYDYVLSVNSGVLTLSKYAYPVEKESAPICAGPLVLIDGVLTMNQPLAPDLNRDGVPEQLAVTEDSMVQTLRIYNGDTLLWTEEAASAHVGWNALFLCQREDGDYLLRYRPTMYQGVCSYTFQLFTLEGGAEQIVDQGEVSFDINFASRMHESFDPAAIARFMETVNGYLSTSQPLLVTDEDLLYSIEKNGRSVDDLWFLDQAENGFVRDETATLEENLAAYAASYGPVESLGDATPVDRLPEDLPVDLLFASGAGAWGTWLTVHPDGTFTGQYSDGEMGSNGAEYPNGTRYICDFSGSFGDLRRRTDGSYLMTLQALTCEVEPERQWIEDGVRMIASTPYGIEGGETFVLYPPDTAAAGLSGEFLRWCPDAWSLQQGELETIKGYSLRNVNTEQGFFSH